MTLPSSGAITDAMIMAELRIVNPGRAYPLSLTDADVLKLIGKNSVPVNMPADFYGKSSYVPMMVSANGGYDFSSSVNGGGVAVAEATVTATNGQGAKTVQWVVVRTSNNPTINNTTSFSCTVSKPYNQNTNGTASATLRANVTDERGLTVSSNEVVVVLEWGN